MAIFFVIFFVIGFLKAGTIMRWIISLFHLQDTSIVTTSPFQFLDLATKIGLYTGLIFCLPLVIYHLYDFLKDGLNKSEKKIFFVLFPIAVTLFVAGFSYCFAILYYYLSSVSAINLSFGIHNVWDVSSFLSQIILASVFLGLAFQFPIILSFLIRVGIIKVEFLKKHRFYAIAGIFIFVGFLPPPDVFSTIIEALPLVILYQLTIWANSGYLFKKSHTIESRSEVMDMVGTTS